MKKVWCILVITILTGCASAPPPAISRIPADHIQVSEVRSAPDRFNGAEVRWGGTITNVENKSTHTWVEVVSRNLDQQGRPVEETHSGGRFIASFPDFIDPEVYRAGNLITVIGTVEGQSKRLIGDYDYLFPVIAVSSSYLWPEEKEETIIYEYPPPWWYYDPWPYYPYPYTYPHRHKR